MMFLLARLLFIHRHPLRRTLVLLVRYSAFWEIQKPLFSMGLNGCKDNILTNSILLYYPLNFCVYKSQSHLLSRMIATTYPNSAESKIRIKICTGKYVWACIV